MFYRQIYTVIVPKLNVNYNYHTIIVYYYNFTLLIQRCHKEFTIIVISWSIANIRFVNLTVHFIKMRSTLILNYSSGNSLYIEEVKSILEKRERSFLACQESSLPYPTYINVSFYSNCLDVSVFLGVLCTFSGNIISIYVAIIVM